MIDLRRSKKNKKGKKIWLVIAAIIGVIVIGIAIFALYFYNFTKNTVNERMNVPVDTIDTNLSKKKLKGTKPINVLLLGIDAHENQNGRSDAIMIMQLQPKDDAMTIVSIPRDARTEIVGKGFDDKINHAYAFGGPNMSVDTVENFLDIDLDYYVTINMDGLVELVDELGTVSVMNDVAWSDSKYDFPIGAVEMDGDKTMAFVRMRKKDNEGDFGRTKRHRKVIEAILSEGASAGSIPKFKGLVDVLGGNMETNMDFDDMKKLFGGYTNTRKNISEYMINGTGKNIDGIYYLIVPDEEIKKAHDLLTIEE